jgi:hypothetical protein
VKEDGGQLSSSRKKVLRTEAEHPGMRNAEVMSFYYLASFKRAVGSTEALAGSAVGTGPAMLRW